MNWKYHERAEVIGTESAVVIIYNHYHFRYESYTRAKHQLIIITISSLSEYVRPSMAAVLRGIESGEHHELTCQDYHKELQKRFKINDLNKKSVTKKVNTILIRI